MNLNHIILLHWNEYSTWTFCEKNQTNHWSAFKSIKTILEMDSDLRESRRFRLAKVVSNKTKAKQKQKKNEQQKKEN